MLALLQFDSAGVPVMERMLSEGRLPTVAGLRERGAWRRLEQPSSLFQSSTYPTLHTGLPLTRHGLYSAFVWSGSGQRLRYMHAFDKPPTVWERLGEAGRRSLVVDPYQSWAPAEASGVYLGGWQFEDRMVMKAASRPGGVRRRLARRHGAPPRLDDVYGRWTAERLLDLRRHMVAAPGRTAAAVTDLMGSERFDLLWLNFSSAHRAGHHLWDVSGMLDGASPGERRELEGGLEDVYAAVDAALARVLDALPADTDVILFSPIGMGPNTSRSDLLPPMLDAVLSGGANGSPGRGAPIWRLRAAIPQPVRAAAARALPDRLVYDATTRLYLRRDWRRTRAMVVPGECHGYVRLNLAGRERDGVVDPAEADALMDEIAEGLESFADPDGHPSIASVERVSGLVGACACADQLPDLLVRFPDRPANAIDRVASPRFGEVLRRGIGSGRTGHHNSDAWAAVVPGNGSRATEPDPEHPPGIVDVGATACAALGVEAGDLPGRPLLEP